MELDDRVGVSMEVVHEFHAFFSVSIVAVDCWPPISFRVMWLILNSAVMMGTACWLPMKMPPVSALATEETTFCRVLQMTWMSPLSGGRPEVVLLR